MTGVDLDLPEGHRIAGRYTVERRLSAGAMGAVYAARGDDGSAVAVKRLLEPGQAARFEIEGRLLARLSHPGVVKVIEHVVEEDSQFLVMDLVEGQDLNVILGERGSPGLPVDEVLGYARQAGAALRYVHEQGIVHRDVKPHNLIRSDGGLVLVDFGIAREVDSAQAGATRAIGTPLYMAPEILVGEELSPRSDVYSLAATIWALLMGAPPAYDDSTPLAQSVEGVSPELERALRAGLEIRPERRPASVGALLAGLGVPLEGDEGRSLAVSVPGSTARGELLEAIVRTVAGVFEGTAASIALTDRASGELVYRASWGAGADEIAGVRLPPGEGIAGAVVESGEGVAIADCRADERFARSIAEKTGYVPHTMLVSPLARDGVVVGALSVLDRRDGRAYGASDLERAQLFAELAVVAIEREGLQA
jgi:predicted Ser/Thr protein kinase